MNKRIVCLIVLIALAGLSLVACVSPSSNVANTNTAPPSKPAENAPAAQPAASKPQSVMFTLPVLKAFLANETFQADLKKRLQLSDEQIRQLTAATEKPETAATATADTSTHDAREQAAVKLRALLGDEKTQQLAALVDEYWRGAPPAASTPAASTTPASTPAKPAPTPAPNGIPADTRIVINAPAYRMDVFEGGKLMKSYKIGIGYPEFPLPIGMRQAKEIIFNPTWTPPDEPWVEASDKVKVGEKVAAGDKLNPLGIAKIPIGMPSLIHGGKRPAQIGGFASHGCVGLTDAQLREFIPLLADVGGAQVSDKEIAQFGKDRTKTQSTKLTTAVPIELRYETIVVEDGKLYIYRDIYDMNTNTEGNLRAVLAAYGITLEQLTAAEQAKIMTALKDMSRDAAGRLDPAGASSSSAGKTDTRNSSQSASAKKEKENESGKVTRTVKGAKEVVIDIAALKGKGYPAPVALNSGGASVKPVASTTRRKS